MQYQLSRNNIVTGPYTKEMLIRHGILQTDLIKEEGSDEWLAPHNFPDIKDAVSTTKPKFKITADKEVIEVKKEEAKKENAAAELPANSPFRRMPSAAPKRKNSTETATGTEKIIPKKEAVSRTEKPATNDINPAPQMPEKIVYKKSARPVVYGKTPNKENTTNVTKEIFAPLLIIGSIGVAAWLGYKEFSGPALPAAPTITASTDSVTAQKITADSPKVAAIPVVTKKHIVIDSSLIYARRDSIRKAERAKRDSPALIAKVNAPKTDSAQAKNTIAIKPSEVKNIQPLTTEIKKQEPVVAKTPEKKTPAKKAKTINDYVALSLNKEPNKEVKNIKINVKNISDRALNIAVIDVSYLDANGNFLKGETLQAENIGAGKTASVKVPNEKTAASISYKVSLISGDSVYLMGK